MDSLWTFQEKLELSNLTGSLEKDVHDLSIYDGWRRHEAIYCCNMIFMALEIRSLILALRVEIYDSQWTLRTKRNSDDGRDKYNGNVTRMRLS